ncbi:MAG: CRISPR-associated helicase Cas3' [Thermoprotei archaeon]
MIIERPGLDKAREIFSKDHKLVFIAPTGYGKTILSIQLYKELVENGSWSGLIHIAPFRALIREIYSEKFKPYVPNSGYQSLDHFEATNKSPYYLRSLIATTLDSFVYNIYKIPVAEMRKIYKGLSQGHYYPILLSIFTSIVVFDEAHIYLGDINEDLSVEGVTASVKFLSETNTPLLIETATMHSSFIYTIARDLLGNTKVLYIGDDDNKQVEKMKKMGLYVETIRDIKFEKTNSFKWHTELIDENNLMTVLRGLCNSNLVLLITNTVKKAIEIYQKIIDLDVCNKVVLIHGLLSSKDREKALKQVHSIKAGVVVSTQVIEAGVEIPSRILITEPAPIENITQRAGRLCREKYRKVFEECHEEKPMVYIIRLPDDQNTYTNMVGPYHRSRVESAIKQIADVIIGYNRGIDWRLTVNHDNYISYVELLENTEALKQEINVRTQLLENYLRSDAIPETLISILESIGIRSLTRSGFLVNILVNPKNVCNGEIHDLDELEIVTIDLERILKFDTKRADTACLEYIEENEGKYLRLATLIATWKGTFRLRCDTRSKKPIFGKPKTTSFSDYIDYTTPIDPETGKPIKDYVFTLLISSGKCYEKNIGFEIW